MSLTKFLVTCALVILIILGTVDAVFRGKQVLQRDTKNNFVVALVVNANPNELMGAGALIRANAVLTSPLLLIGKTAVDVKVYAGFVNFKLGMRQAQSLFTHPDYSQGAQIFEVAIVKTSSPFTLSATLNLAALPIPGNQYAQVSADIFGWGQIGVGDYSNILRNASVTPTYNNSQCIVFGYQYPLPNDLCTLKGQGTNCNGDYGAPLVLSGTNIIIGLFKFNTVGEPNNDAETCENPLVFSVYDRLTESVLWIKSTLAANP